MKTRPDAEHRRHKGRPPPCPVSAEGLTLRPHAASQPEAWRIPRGAVSPSHCARVVLPREQRKLSVAT